MYSSKDLNNIIKEHVSKLNLKWFEKKNDEFVRNSKYDPVSETIIIQETQGFPNYGDDGEILNYEVVEEIHRFNFPKYCACYLPISELTFWGVEPIQTSSDKAALNNIDEIATQLVKEISSFLKDIDDIIIIHKFIARRFDDIENEINLQRTTLEVNKSYDSVFDEFLKLCISKLNRKYERQLTLYNESVEQKDKLNFELNQEELAALLFLLNDAGFFRKPTVCSQTKVDLLLDSVS